MDAMSFWFRSPIIESKRENKLFFIKLATIFGLEFSLWVRFLLFVSRYLAFIVNHNYTTIWGILFDFSNHLKQIYISFFIRFVLSLKIYFPNLSCFFGSQICVFLQYSPSTSSDATLLQVTPWRSLTNPQTSCRSYSQWWGHWRCFLNKSVPVSLLQLQKSTKQLFQRSERIMLIQKQ